MKIEDLKAHNFGGDQVSVLLMPELLALVEAVNYVAENYSVPARIRDPLLAFNAKLEAL